MEPILRKRLRRLRRKRHVRKRVTGTPDRPRLTVFRSHKNIYAQIIDDVAAQTLVAASSMEKPMRDELPAGGGNTSAAKAVGKVLAAKAVQAGICKVVFDRNGYAFHGRVRELAQAAREGGLKF